MRIDRHTIAGYSLTFNKVLLFYDEAVIVGARGGRLFFLHGGICQTLQRALRIAGTGFLPFSCRHYYHFHVCSLTRTFSSHRTLGRPYQTRGFRDDFRRPLVFHDRSNAAWHQHDVDLHDALIHGGKLHYSRLYP